MTPDPSPHSNHHTRLPRVLFVDQSAELGGAELSLLDIAAHWGDRGRVALFEQGGFVEKLGQRGVAVTVLGDSDGGVRFSRSGGWAKAARAIPTVTGLVRSVARLAKRGIDEGEKAGGFDIIYANTQKAFVVAALAGWLCGRPVVWHLRDILTADHFSRFNRRLVVTLANRLATRVIANSRATAEAFVQSGGRRDRVTVIYNAVPTPTLSESASEATGNDGSKDKTLGVFARLAPWKGQHVLIDALAMLPGDVRLLVVGGPLFGEDAYEAELHQQVIRLGLSQRVEFLGFRPDATALMQEVSLVVHASTSPEPFGRVIVEAMLAHTPIVASDAGGAREILEHDRTGLLFPPDDAPALAHAIASLLNDPAHARALADAALQDARQRFTLPRLMEELEATLSDLSTRRRR